MKKNEFSTPHIIQIPTGGLDPTPMGGSRSHDLKPKTRLKTSHSMKSGLNNRTHRKAIETVRERLPKTNTVPPLALVEEPVDPVDGCTFMVPSEDKEVFGVQSCCQDRIDMAP